MRTAALLLLAAFASICQAEDFCSLRVTVRESDGAIEPEVPVIVEESSGRRTERRTNNKGLAEFCNLGILPVTVTVGDSGCAQSIVRNVPATWGKTNELVVTRDQRLCNHEELPVAACKFLLRVEDAKANPIASARFQFKNKDQTADAYGRILVRVPAGTDFEAVATAPGYKPSAVRIPCTSANSRIERSVVLVQQK